MCIKIEIYDLHREMKKRRFIKVVRKANAGWGYMWWFI